MTLKKIANHFKISQSAIEKKNTKSSFSYQREMMNLCVLLLETKMTNSFLIAFLNQKNFSIENYSDSEINNSISTKNKVRKLSKNFEPYLENAEKLFLLKLTKEEKEAIYILLTGNKKLS